MAITDFALNYNKQITLNYSQMVELSKAISHRSVEYLKRITQELDDSIIEIYRENLDILIQISQIINPLIDEAVLINEEQIAAKEAEDLNDVDKLKKFLEE
jgi:predicted transcriptional regulator